MNKDNRLVYSYTDKTLREHGIEIRDIYKYSYNEVLNILKERICDIKASLDRVQKELEEEYEFDLYVYEQKLIEDIFELKAAYTNILFRYEPKPIKKLIKKTIQSIIVSPVKGSHLIHRDFVSDEIDSCIHLRTIHLIFFFNGAARNIQNGLYKITKFYINKIMEDGVKAQINISVYEVEKV